MTVNGRGETSLIGRFAVFSMATVVTGHVILYVLHSVIGIAPVASNAISALLNTGIVLVVNRRWVWGVDGPVSLRREVVPFLAIAGAGLAVSSLLVWLTARSIGEGLWVNLANLAGFGAVWLARFVVLDRVVYARSRAE